MNTKDKGNMDWLRANTKKCPKCGVNIEKNQGCMHMRCTKCRHEFCWMCGMTWFNHRSATHAGCNKSDHILKTEKEAQKSQGRLARLMFYYSRFEAHSKALEFAQKDLKRAEERMAMMLELKHSDWSYKDTEFLKSAVEEVIRCRRILQWTYCFGFFLKDQTAQKYLFEDHQGKLEEFADRLHELTELPEYDLIQLNTRQDVLNLTRSIVKFRNGILDYCEGMDFIEHDFKFLEDKKEEN